MGIFVVLVLLIVLSALALAGKVTDSRDSQFWSAAFSAGRDATRRLRHG